MLTAGWLALLHGLYSTAPTSDPALDLDAGESFGENFGVYLPSMVLTVLLGAMLLGLMLARAGIAVGVGAGLVSVGFIAWVATQDALLVHLPGLAADLSVAAGLGVGAIALTLGTPLYPQVRRRL